MAYGYGRTNKPIDVTEFLIKRWANLYPLYLVTVVAGAWISFVGHFRFGP